MNIVGKSKTITHRSMGRVIKNYQTQLWKIKAKCWTVYFEFQQEKRLHSQVKNGRNTKDLQLPNGLAVLLGRHDALKSDKARTANKMYLLAKWFSTITITRSTIETEIVCALCS